MLIAIAAVLLQAQVSASAQPAPKMAADKQTSTRCVAAAESPDARVAPKPSVAPGPPPMLSFRYFEGKLHHRFNNMDLMLDDAGH